MKNYYIVLPLTILNIEEAFIFIESENKNFCNIGDNRVFEIIPNPKNEIFPCWRIELKETLLSNEWVINGTEIPSIKETYLQTFTRLGAEMYESAADYLIVYPQITTEEI